MKKAILVFVLICGMTLSAHALDITAPTVPDSAEEFMPAETESFGEGLRYVIEYALEQLFPEITEACGICVAVIAVALLVSLLGCFPGKTKPLAEMVGTVAVALLLLSGTNSLIIAAKNTIQELSDYGKLLLPVMTAAMAAQGGGTGSAALYTGTAFFDSVLGTLISAVLVPVIYMFLALAIANSALGDDILKRIRDFIKWLVTWCLKTILYIFTGYMSITGVVSGTTDQAAIKAAKLTISGVVPVVGGILSDASESILVSAGVVKSAAGTYGLLAIISIFVGPFLRIGVQYLMLKLSAAVCGVFNNKRLTELVQDFSTAMGLLLAMTGAVCLLLIISTVCFLKGAG